MTFFKNPFKMSDEKFLCTYNITYLLKLLYTIINFNIFLVTDVFLATCGNKLIVLNIFVFKLYL